MALVAKVTTGLVALPHIVLLLQKREVPRLNYVILLVICLFIIFGYTSMLEVCGGPSLRRSVATGLLPPVLTSAVIMSAILYSVNDNALAHYLSMQATLLGTPLGQVKQYRLNDVIDRFRTMVTNRYDESHGQGFN